MAKIIVFRMRGVPERRDVRRTSFKMAVDFEACDRERRFSISRGTGRCVDISPEGIGFSTKTALREGDVLKFELPLGKARVHVPALAEVRWVLPAGGGFRAGLRFLI